MTERIPLTVTVPWVPPIRMSPNRGTPTRTMKRYRAEAKEATILALRSLLCGAPRTPYMGPVRFTFTVHWGTGRRHWDRDNLATAFKGVQDSFEVERIIANDRQATDPVIRQLTSGGQGYLVVDVEAA